MSLSQKHTQKINDLLKGYNNDLEKEEKIKLSKEIVNYFMDLQISDTTKTVYISLAKKMISEKIKDDIFINSIVPKIEFTKRIKKENIQRRDEREMIEINEEQINKLFSFDNNDDIFKLNMYLLFVTGRRFSELLYAEFINKKKNKNLFIKGILKRRKEEETMDGCLFPIIGTKTKIIKQIKRFQKEASKFKFENYKRTFTRRIKKEFNNDWSPHTLRGIYAKYMYKNNNKGNLQINPFIKKVLCHKSIESSLSYTRINLV